MLLECLERLENQLLLHLEFLESHYFHLFPVLLDDLEYLECLVDLEHLEYQSLLHLEYLESHWLLEDLVFPVLPLGHDDHQNQQVLQNQLTLEFPENHLFLVVLDYLEFLVVLVFLDGLDFLGCLEFPVNQIQQIPEYQVRPEYPEIH